MLRSPRFALPEISKVLKFTLLVYTDTRVRHVRRGKHSGKLKLLEKGEKKKTRVDTTHWMFPKRQEARETTIKRPSQYVYNSFLHTRIHKLTLHKSI